MNKARNPPDRIYLQVGDIDRDCEFAECESSGEVTWCADKINDNDIEYRLVKRKRNNEQNPKT
jgi:hypothetical protein